MKLSKLAILAIKGAELGLKTRIQELTGVHYATVCRWISENKDNGELTKASMVKAIQEETGLTVDQILEDIEVTEENREAKVVNG